MALWHAAEIVQFQITDTWRAAPAWAKINRREAWLRALFTLEYHHMAASTHLFYKTPSCKHELSHTSFASSLSLRKLALYSGYHYSLRATRRDDVHLHGDLLELQSFLKTQQRAFIAR